MDSNGNMGSQAVLTLGAVGASPNANAMTLSAGRVLNLELASNTQPGITGTGAQTFAGVKSFNANIVASQGVTMGGGATGALFNSAGSNLLWNGAGIDTSSIYAGVASGGSSTSGAKNNNAVGSFSLNGNTTGNFNTAYGDIAAKFLITGNHCLALGASAGTSWTTSESNNIAIANSGVTAESAAIRVGTNGTHTTCFVAGISGVTSAGAVPAVINASGQLGTVVSSKRKKNTISPVKQEKLDALMQLECVSFYMNDDINKEYLNYGFIAEDVEPILPEVIRYEPMEEVVDGETKVCMDEKQNVKCNMKIPQTIDYSSLWPLLLAQTQQVTKELKELKRWRSDLEDANPALFKIQKIA
jgi:hypothetical protein